MNTLREQAAQLVESILRLAEKASRRKLEFGVIANIKTGEQHGVQEQMVDWVEAALRDCEAATWEAAAKETLIYGAQNLADHFRAKAAKAREVTS